MARPVATCPKCGHALEIDPAADAQVLCPGCGAPLTAPREGPMPAPRPASLRAALVGAACGLAVLAIGLAVAYVLRQREQPPAAPDRDQAVTPATSLPATSTSATTTKQPPPAPPDRKVTAEPAWAAALAAADGRAGSLVREGRFTDAVAVYEALARQHHDPLLRQLLEEGIEDVRRKAHDACQAALRRAGDLLAAGHFAEARAALTPVLQIAGLPDAKQQADALLARIDIAERQQREAEARAQAEAAKAAKADTEAEQAFARALESIDRLLEEWDFEGAAATLAQLAPPHPRLLPRLAARRDQVARLAALKAAMIGKINAAKPPLTKGSLLIPGINGDLTKADAKAITVTFPDGRRETHPWQSLGPRSIARALQLAIDPGRADDWVAAGLLSLVLGDLEMAEKSFDEARARGAAVDAYRDPLAAAAFAQAIAFIEQRQLPQAAQVLASLENKLANTVWVKAHKPDIEAAKARINAELREAEAEELYAEAVPLFRTKQLFRLKPLVDRLRKHYGDTRVVADGQRQPTVAGMTKATAHLGEVVSVSQDGKGQHLSLQKAIDAAAPNSLILILDSAIYTERLFIPKSKKGLTIRAKEGSRPILSSRVDAVRTFRRLVDVEAPEVTFDGLVLALHHFDERSSSSLACIRVTGLPFRIQSCVLYCDGTYSTAIENASGRTTMDHCVVAIHGYIGGPIQASNSIWLTPYARVSGTTRGVAKFDNCVLHKVNAYLPCELHRCTVLGRLDLNTSPNVVRDCIANQIVAERPDTRIEHCDVFGKPGFKEFAAAGLGCIARNPQFLEPEHFDFRLKSTSPCRGKASDKGDIGCRFTRQMADLRKLAYDLRERGIIKFTPFGQWDPDWLD